MTVTKDMQKELLYLERVMHPLEDDRIRLLNGSA